MKKVLLILSVLSLSLFAKELTVSILPQKYFVEKIAKDKFNVNVMVKPGFSPATYEPKTSQMRALSKSKVYFSIGVPFESIWLEKFKNSNKNLLFVDTSKGIKKLEMEAHSHEEEDEHGHNEHKEVHHEHKKHAHHEHEEHTHHNEHEGHEHEGGLDPHIWLDPMLVKVQAKTIYETLSKIDKENKEFYLKNYKKFIVEIESLNKDLNDLLKPYSHKAFMVFHPSYGYFAKRYDLEQISIEVQGKEPKPAQLVELLKEAKLHNIKVVFTSKQFSTSGAKSIAKGIKGNVVAIDPLALNWDENLINIAKEIVKSYK